MKCILEVSTIINSGMSHFAVKFIMFVQFQGNPFVLSPYPKKLEINLEHSVQNKSLNHCFVIVLTIYKHRIK